MATRNGPLGDDDVSRRITANHHLPAVEAVEDPGLTTAHENVDAPHIFILAEERRSWEQRINAVGLGRLSHPVRFVYKVPRHRLLRDP